MHADVAVPCIRCVLHRDKGVTGTREHLGQARTDALADRIGVGEDDDAALFIGGTDIFDRRIAQAKSIGDDAVRIDRTPHRRNVHLALDDDDFFDHNRLLHSSS